MAAPYIQKPIDNFGSNLCFCCCTCTPPIEAKLRSAYNGKFLTSLATFDQNRRQLTMAHEGEPWILKRDGIYFRITRKQCSEDLYAAKDEYAADDQRRRIFTWIPKHLPAGQCPPDSFRQWEIISVPGTGGKVYLRSVRFGEYLMAEFNQNVAYTWRPKDDPNGEARFLWQIEHC